MCLVYIVGNKIIKFNLRTPVRASLKGFAAATAFEGGKYNMLLITGDLERETDQLEIETNKVAINLIQNN